MHSRILTGWLLVALVAVPATGMAEEPRGRARTWDIEANVGVSIIDTGFDRKTLGYDLFTPTRGTSKIPPTKADHVDTDIPTVGLRFSYNFVRFFGLELGTVVGETGVGDNTVITLQENFAIPQAQRETILNQQTATAPQILQAYESLDFSYSNTDLSAIFKFNNKVQSKFVFYGTLGGGYFALNPDSGAYNNCNDASNNMVFDASVSKYNGDPNAPAGSDPPRDLFEDNPEQLRYETGCGRGFLVGTQTGLAPDENGVRQPVIVIGSVFQDAVPQTDPLYTCPGGGFGTPDPDTGQIICDGEGQWIVPPGVLATAGLGTTGKVNGFEEFFYTIGAGLRWHIKPRHVMRFDAKRSFIENGNKNSNQITIGYSFVLGRGKPDQPDSMTPPPGEMLDDDDSVPPPDDDGAVPPPAGDDGRRGVS